MFGCIKTLPNVGRY